MAASFRLRCGFYVLLEKVDINILYYSYCGLLDMAGLSKDEMELLSEGVPFSRKLALRLKRLVVGSFVNLLLMAVVSAMVVVSAIIYFGVMFGLLWLDV